MIRTIIFAAAFATVGLASAANAAVTFTPYGPPSPGATLITDFSSGNGLSGSFRIMSGTTGLGAAPAIDSTQQDPNLYLSILGGDSATLALTNESTVEIYVGSLDSYNTISFSNGETFAGSQLGAVPGAAANGDQQSGASNGLFTFTFAAPVTSVTFASSGNSLEVAAVYGAAPVSVLPGAPEPATWAMMGLGFAALGFGAFRRASNARPAIG